MTTRDELEQEIISRLPKASKQHIHYIANVISNIIDDPDGYHRWSASQALRKWKYLQILHKLAGEAIWARSALCVFERDRLIINRKSTEFSQFPRAVEDIIIQYYKPETGALRFALIATGVAFAAAGLSGILISYILSAFMIVLGVIYIALAVAAAQSFAVYVSGIIALTLPIFYIIGNVIGALPTIKLNNSTISRIETQIAVQIQAPPTPSPITALPTTFTPSASPNITPVPTLTPSLVLTPSSTSLVLTPSKTPTPEPLVEAEWTERMERDKTYRVRVTLKYGDQLLVTPSIVPGNQARILTPVPIGTPGPIPQAFGVNYNAVIIATLDGDAFEIKERVIEYSINDWQGRDFDWFVTPRQSGNLELLFKVEIKWNPVNENAGSTPKSETIAREILVADVYTPMVVFDEPISISTLITSFISGLVAAFVGATIALFTVMGKNGLVIWQRAKAIFIKPKKNKTTITGRRPLTNYSRVIRSNTRYRNAQSRKIGQNKKNGQRRARNFHKTK